MNAGWEIKTLGEVCEEIFAGGDVPKDSFSKIKTEKFRIPIYSNGEKNKGLFGYTDKPRISKTSITISARGTIGYSEIRTQPFYPVVRLIVVVPSNDILDLSFLQFVISSIDFTHSGSSIPQLTVPMIKQYKIPLPPLPEQKRLVTLLDEAFESIATAKANAEKNLKNARALFESHLNEVFTKRGEGWEEKTLDKLTLKIGSGATPKGGESAYKESGISLVRSLNVHDFGFRYAKLAFIDDTQANKLSNVELNQCDVLLNITGASVARCCVVPDEVLPARVNQHVSIIRPITDKLNANYLHYLLISKPYKDKLLQTGEDGGSTRQAITKAQIQAFKISYPKLETQQMIVTKLDTFRKETQRLEALYSRKIAALDELKKALLHRAFSGAL